METLQIQNRMLQETVNSTETNFEETHKELVLQSQCGNSLAQNQLYQLYSQAMYKVCFSIMKNQSEAEDILQEAFCQAFVKLNSFRFESSFGAWLKRIVVNMCLNEINRRKADLIFTDNFSYCNEHQEEIENADQADNMSKFRNALNNLSVGYRNVISLYLLEGYDHSEIAQIMNISESTSRSQYNRAKRKVKELMQFN